MTNKLTTIDKLYIKVFLSNNGGLLGSILSSLKIEMKDDLPTLARVFEDKMQLHTERFPLLSQAQQTTVLLHELWHIALLHIPRGIGKYSNVWNRACDVRINNDLIKAGHSMPEGEDEGVHDLDVDEPTKLSEEELYELYLQETPEEARGSPNSLDDSTQEKCEQHVALTQRALLGCDGSTQDDATASIRRHISLLTHKPLPWHRILYEHLQDSLVDEVTWTRPNRRYLASGMYLPARNCSPNPIEHLAIYIDTSGSVRDSDVAVFIHEIKSIVDTLAIDRCSIHTFNISIEQSFELQDDPNLNRLKGYGGTNLQCAVNHMVTINPDVAVVFSDLEDFPPNPIEGLPPIFWIKTPGQLYQCTPTFGKVIPL